MVKAMDEKEQTAILHGKNVQHLSQMANYFSQISPGASRFYMSSANEIVQKKSAPTSASSASFCPHCGSIYDADNHTVRILARGKQTRTIWRLLKKQAQYGQATLDTNERHLLDEYANTRSKISITCKICHQRQLVECPEKPPKPVIEESLPQTEAKKKKKKKKKKDVTCGLNVATPKSQPGSNPSLLNPSISPASSTSTPVADGSKSGFNTTVAATATPSQKGTPISSNKKHPAQTTFSSSSMTPGHKMGSSTTPQHTPNFSVQTPLGLNSLSSKKKTKMKHSQLKHMLEQDRKNKKSQSSAGLHSFLSSL